MIISKTPLRISFFGGGSDYPEWYNEHNGAVLSTTINKYVYITVRYLPPYFEHKHRIVWAIVENTKDINSITHPSVRECLKYTGISEGVEIHYDGDLPARSGTGSSSAFTVGLLNSLFALNKQINISKEFLAREAVYVEQNLIKENVGSQDQYAAAYGGFNLITFSKDKIQVDTVRAYEHYINFLEKYFLLLFVGFPHNASEIAKSYDLQSRKVELLEMMQMAKEGCLLIHNGDILSFGKLLGEAWNLKKKLSNQITTPYIDYVYDKAVKAGAESGKILGAGNGGFMLLFCEPEKQERVKKALEGMLFVDFKFEKEGSKIIFNNE